MIPLNRLVHGWVDFVFFCYDFYPSSPLRMARLRSKYFDLGREMVRDGKGVKYAFNAVLDLAEQDYIAFHQSAKRLSKHPRMMSCKKEGARK